MAIPKEPGLYPVMWYNEEKNKENCYCVCIGPKNLEKGGDFIAIFQLNNKASTESLTYAQLKLCEFGPRIVFPKGGWRN